jgi:DNA helicase II / ATP-dependent DNA helicase PcrA
MATRVWSEKQQNIFAWFADFTLTVIRHLVVRARAGTGKTTTIIEALSHLPKGVKALVCAFNKDIQLELVRKLAEARGITVAVSSTDKRYANALRDAVLQATGVNISTLHSAGLAVVSSVWPKLTVDFGDTRARDLARRACPNDTPESVQKLVAKLCTNGRDQRPHAARGSDLIDLAIKFECEPNEEDTAKGFNVEFVCVHAVKAMILAAAEKPTKTGIDGADMIFLPIRNGWLKKRYDIVIVDEAQDMTVAQLEIAQGLCRGSVVVVGDDKQAIYDFRGADSDSLDRLKTELGANELPLNTTYRCGKAIVEVARQFVPDFEAGENNSEGEVTSIAMGQLTATASLGDFILSRANAPLVSVAMSLLRAGKRARIKGRDIGKGLAILVSKLKARSVPELLERLTTWEEREITRLEARFKGRTDSDAFVARVEGIHDQAAMIASLTDGAESVSAVVERIEALFTDDGMGAAGVITCSSVHRAKGLEAKRVFVLKDTLRYNTQEELNICYVAVTRAIDSLVWVAGKEAA